MGGIAEMFLVDEEKEQVLLRRGFIREAMKNGIDIMYVLGWARWGNVWVDGFVVRDFWASVHPPPSSNRIDAHVRTL